MSEEHKALLNGYDTYPNGNWERVVRITHEQASEFMGEEAGTWELFNKAYEVFKGNADILGVYNHDGQLWLLRCTCKHLTDTIQERWDREDDEFDRKQRELLKNMPVIGGTDEVKNPN